ncbi:hypothetical protein [Actibacterium sp. XHP0104]|uniref:hypothetical protein n=1 Tax=Actibacterium sp. XHP0104 TaxID=2984335 RepID=UPI0021E8BF07|nr:hypothetical protein [Actibacterium sp. XHP0104]MCV2882870.1 hypothetical protein [Actibacterium sp. XHP0104]
MSLVEIQQAPALRVAGVVHAGPFHLIGKAFDRLHGYLAADAPGDGLIAVYCARDQWALAGVVLPDGRAAARWADRAGDSRRAGRGDDRARPL